MIVNLRDNPTKPYVRVDRRSKWGNPFVIGKDGNREEVIVKYRAWLEHQISNGDISEEELMELDGKTLACWCVPKPCHANVLASVVAQVKSTKDFGG